MYPFNLCSSVLPQLPLEAIIDLATQTGLKGLELRVHPEGHQSVDQIEQRSAILRQQFEQAGLSIPVLNSYVAAEDFATIHRLIACAQQLGTQKIRLVLPRVGDSAHRQASPHTIIPSYELHLHPTQMLSHLQMVLEKLEVIAYRAGITFLFELHWGTIISSFSAAYWILKEFDPKSIAVTFDPANMVIEGKEDWDYGIALLSPYICNVHVKNVVWEQTADTTRWNWSPIQTGVLNWEELIRMLTKNGYDGDFAIEDFRFNTKDTKQAKLQLEETLRHLVRYYENSYSSLSNVSLSSKQNCISEELIALL
jgi:sugar phosphate isomerase/epimerase